MKLYDINPGPEKLLQIKADCNKIPLGGSIELLPLCNMDCKMCYVRKTKAEMDAEGRMLSCDEWLRIADEAVEAGALFLLITGGEPLIYPEFKRLYAELAKKGLILSVNTNGTLIDEEWAAFFAEHGCRRLNITLYGKDDATYEKLCRNPRGFTQVMNACRLLKAYDVPFRLTCSLTPDNVDQMEELFAVAKEFGSTLAAATYMFPGSRRGVDSDVQYRLSPEEAAAAMMQRFRLEHPDIDMATACRATFEKTKQPGKLKVAEGFNCHSGRSGFWLNWKGEMTPCGVFGEPKVNLLEHSFQDCWKEIVAQSNTISYCDKCLNCDLQNICDVCPAACYTETGSTDGCPEYVCRMTHETVRLMEAYIKEEEDAHGSL